LAVGILTDLLARGPLLAFTTHFPQVKTFALAERALEVAAFDLDPAAGTPRSHLDYHSVGQSLALPIARRHGLPARALETAERLLAGESRDVPPAVGGLQRGGRARPGDARAPAEGVGASGRELEGPRKMADAEAARLAAARAETDALNA